MMTCNTNRPKVVLPRRNLGPQERVRNFADKYKVWLAFGFVILAVIVFILAIIYFVVTLTRAFDGPPTHRGGGGNATMFI